MGIRLDWEVEAEQAKVRQGAGEDPQKVRQRWRQRLGLLLLTLLVVGVIVGVVGLVQWRLREGDAKIEQDLRNTVDAEVAALRLGALDGFLIAQRSASEEWLQVQQALFDAYQQLKQTHDIALTGHILSVAKDGQRARVAVQEIIDNVPYTQTWFYWQYDDGWRHVPPDYTFWGERLVWNGSQVRVDYQAVDALYATSVGTALEQWLAEGCAILGCATLPNWRIQVTADTGAKLGWAVDEADVLLLPSPYLGRARTDQPFELDEQIILGRLVAERLFSFVSPGVGTADSTDAAYLQESILNWLVGHFAQVDTGSYLLQSAVVRGGAGVVGQVARGLRESSSLALVAQALGVQTWTEANLDWRDLIKWRLNTEAVLIQRRDEIGFLAFYDTRNAATLQIAGGRFSGGVAALQSLLLQDVVVEAAADGAPLLRARVQAGDQTQDIQFAWTSETWKRLN